MRHFRVLSLSGRLREELEEFEGFKKEELEARTQESGGTALPASIISEDR